MHDHMKPHPCGGWVFPDFRRAALEAERKRLLAMSADVSIAELDARMAALKTLYAQPAEPVLESRSAATVGVDESERIITVIAVPYDQPATVPWRGELWTEVFTRSAFTNRLALPEKLRVNRDHDKTRTVGKVVRADPNHNAGLLTEIRIAQTMLGDETLALAAEDCLSASVGFGVPPGGERLDRTRKHRTVTAAVLDHIALVASPAYDGAQVVGVTA